MENLKKGSRQSSSLYGSQGPPPSSRNSSRSSTLATPDAGGYHIIDEDGIGLRKAPGSVKSMNVFGNTNYIVRAQYPSKGSSSQFPKHIGPHQYNSHPHVDLRQRNRHRGHSNVAHRTVVVDGRLSSLPKPLFTSMARRGITHVPHPSLARKQTEHPGRIPATPTITDRQEGARPIVFNELSIPRPTKSSKIVVPQWQIEDAEYESRSRSLFPNKHARNKAAASDFDYLKRASIATAMGASRKTSATNVIGRSGDVDADPNRTRVFMAPGLQLTKEGEGSDSKSGYNVSKGAPRHQPRSLAKTRLQLASKFSAARKSVALMPVSSDEDDNDEDDDSSGPDSDDEGAERDISEHGSPKNSEGGDETDNSQDENEDIAVREPPELAYLDPTPRITIPLPQIAPEQQTQLLAFQSQSQSQQQRHQQSQQLPLDDLITAVEALSLSAIRMRQTKQLPFLRRNLRLGFKSRCDDLGIPTFQDDNDEIPDKIEVRYDYPPQAFYETFMNHYWCPLCELHGAFPTRDMLVYHLEWDHQEVYIEWEETSVGWRVLLLIPQPAEELVDPAPLSRTSPIRNSFPLSPAKPTPSRVRAQVEDSNPYPSIKRIAALQEEERRASSVPSSRDRSTTTASFATSSETSATTSETTTEQNTPVPQTQRYPTPPPPTDPLGPSARPPYLPAVSYHGGPTVYYSCRPLNGPCLFDLLGTLPMEQFGVLDWAVRDREEEIYEVDDVREEWKVVHALWARWIILHRKEFIANYYKGTISFVDEYWRMIHRAAGWDALRYLLFTFVADKFLTGQDMAGVLKHYESLTGMQFWYK